MLEDDLAAARGRLRGGRAGEQRDGANVTFQHVEMYRKLLLRRQLLQLAGDPPGAAAVPFCGDGDLTAELYADRTLYAVDFDPARTATFQTRFPDANVHTGDADKVWPWGSDAAELAVIDLDAWAYPYDTWRSITARHPLAPVVVVVFTDGEKGTIQRNGIWRTPDGVKHTANIGHSLKPDTSVTRKVHAEWVSKTLRPWIAAEAPRLGFEPPWLVRSYLRRHMVYWGAVLERAR